MSTDCTEVTGPHGTATVATVQDTPLTPRRHTIGLREGRSMRPVAVFLRSPERGAVKIGAATVHQGSYADAVAFARELVGSPSPEDATND
jgi:hypothetical protein